MIQFDTDNITIVDGIGLLMPFPRGSNFEVKKGVTYTISVKQKRGKRSLNANGYAWVLMQKIAEELSKNGLYTSRNKEMARLIDCLVDECQQLGIDTKPKEEIDSLLAEWSPHE